MKLTIDNITIDDFDITQNLSVTFSISSMTDIEKEKTGYTKTIKVPITPQTRAIFGAPEDVHSKTFFNQQDYNGVIDDEGVIIASGSCFLQKSETNTLGAGYYHINIIGAGKEWAVNASITKQSETKINFNQQFNEENIKTSWVGTNKPLVWIPVYRAPFSYINDDRKTITRKMNYWDYHPFINVQTLFNQIFSDAGYKVVSNFISKNGLSQYYISGYLNKADLDETKKDWDFYAGRYFDTVVNNSYTTVHYFGGNPSTGSIVDTTDRDTPKMQGNEVRFVDDAFDNSGSFKFDGNECYFQPNKDVAMGFKADIYYSTRISYMVDTISGSPHTVVAYPAFYGSLLWDGQRKDTYVNSFISKTLYGYTLEEGKWGFDKGYTESFLFLVLENYEELENQYGDKMYAFVKYKVSSTSDVYTRFPLTGAITIISGKYQGQPSNNNFEIVELDIRTEYEGQISEAKYNVFLSLSNLDIRGTFESAVEKIPAGSIKKIPPVIIGKSLPQSTPPVTIVFSSKTNITPVFPPTGIGIGDNITPELVLSDSTPQAAFLKAIKQLPDLVFYTDVFKKIVYIEPRGDFYTGPYVDWSDKIDLSKPIIIEELGSNISRIFSIGYQDPDYSVEQFNEDYKTELGTFKKPILNRFARPEEEKYENEMFAPSEVKAGSYPPAPSAKLLHVNNDSNEKLVVNFDHRIVRYHGLVTLPEGERLEFPDTNQYPWVSFIESGLCFEDRNYTNDSGNIVKAKGLASKHYDKTINMYNLSKRITCYLHLRSVDIETFARLNSLQHDHRATYILEIDNEKVYCLLEDIIDFKNERTSTKCVFVKKISS